MIALNFWHFTFLESALADPSSEVAYSVSEAETRNTVENYWFCAGRAHDAIIFKMDEPIAPATIPSCMTVSNDKRIRFLFNYFGTKRFLFLIGMALLYK